MAQIYAAILVVQHKSQIQIIGHLFLPASRKIIQKENQSNSSKSKINSKNIKISYKDYNEFVNKYKVEKKCELNFTIPKPFPFMKKDYDQRKLRKMEEILEERNLVVFKKWSENCSEGCIERNPWSTEDLSVDFSG